MGDIHQAIRDAEALLPGHAAPDDEDDPRWAAIIRVADYLYEETDPEPIWAFVVRWSTDADADLQQALGKCVLEHLLEHHFADYFPRVQHQARLDAGFARVFCASSKFGQSEEPDNAAKFDALKTELGGVVW